METEKEQGFHEHIVKYKGKNIMWQDIKNKPIN